MSTTESAPTAEVILGAIIDALSDDLAYEVSQADNVKGVIRDAVKFLGGPFESYRDAWWLMGTPASKRTTACGFCHRGVVLQGGGGHDPVEIECPYCNGTGLAPQEARHGI